MHISFHPTVFRHALMRGFTLIEVLVAMAILAVTLAAANRAALLTIEHTQAIKGRVLADMVAQNRLNLHLANDDWLEGQLQGKATQANIEFYWKETITPTPNPAFRKVVVQVYDPQQPQHVLRTLSGFLINPAFQYAQ